MRIPRFYSSIPLRSNSRVRLDGQAGHHLLRVLRRGIGDPVRIFDGRGGEFSALVVGVQRNTVDLDVLEHTPDDRASPLQSHLGLAVSKGDRMDWAIQKCTELGINSITPLLTERCDVKLPAQRRAKRAEHWRQIARSACEQSARNRIPDIAEAMQLDEWLAAINVELALVCCGDGVTLSQQTPRLDTNPRSLALLVGPEGGLCKQEVELAQQAGFVPTRLGPRTLRTETAPVAMLSIAQYMWGDLG
jgi:16S rRNA (uracil1498-N3)-methyltransferase